MTKAIIVDDEPYGCEALAVLLTPYSNIQVLPFCHSASDAKAAIQKHKPDLVFLDVEMPGKNGFELLEELKEINFDIIFTTSYDQYALKAIRVSALDYLLKPIDENELRHALEKVMRYPRKAPGEQLDVLMQKWHQPSTPVSRIAVATMEGYQMIAISSIISCEAENNYTIIRMKNNKKIVVSRNLKDVEDLLEDHSFARVHRCYLVNLNEVEKFVKGDGGYLVMSDNSTIGISRTKREDLLKKLLPSKE